MKSIDMAAMGDERAESVTIVITSKTNNINLCRVQFSLLIFIHNYSTVL